MRAISATLFLALIASAAAAEEWRSIPLIKDDKVAPEWKHVGWGSMVALDGAVRTESDERGLGLAVYTKERFGDCQLRVVYRPENARSNAGVIIRLDDGILDWVSKDSPAVRRDEQGKLAPEMIEVMKAASEKEQGAWYAVHHGYEVQICDTGDPVHRTGAIYSLAPAGEAPAKPADGWRTMVITLRGNAVEVELDGKQLTSFDPASKNLPERKNWFEPKREARRPNAGYIGLQTHDPGDIVHFKDVSVRPLPQP